MGFVHTKPMVAAQFCKSWNTCWPTTVTFHHKMSHFVTLCHIGKLKASPACI